MNVDLRPAGGEDVPFLAWVMAAAARSHVERGIWDLLVPSEPECLAFLEELLETDARSYCHYTAFSVAAVGGAPASGLCAYDPDNAGLSVLVEAMGETFRKTEWSEEEIDAGLQRIKPFTTCAPEEPPGTWVIECVATLPGFRGHGLVRRLLEHKLDQGRREGYRRAQISVLIGNDAAQRAYEGVGFEVADEKRHRDFETAFGTPGVRRLQRTL